MIIVNRLLEIMELKRKWEESKEKGASRSVCVCDEVGGLSASALGFAGIGG